MINRRLVLSSGLSLAAFSIAGPAFAHREPQTRTSVVWDGTTKTLDVTHTFHIHHAEQALARAGIIEKADLNSLKEQARLALYTEKNFSLSENGNSLDLELIGAESDGRDVFVYQQVALPAAPESLDVSCNLLRKHIRGQINHVDVNLAGRIHSLRFAGSDGSQTAHA